VPGEQHGRLSDPADAPAFGETTTVLAEGAGFRVERILSGALDAPQHYVQDHDEWVVVLAGTAQLEVDGVVHELAAGDWWWLPAGTPHTLVRTEPATSWLAVRSRG
jgi:cupin 2 domain-containing protein